MGESQGPDRAGMWLTSVGASRSRPVFPLLYCLLACLLAVLCIEEDLLLQSHYLLHPFNPYHPFQVSKYEIYVEDYYIYIFPMIGTQCDRCREVCLGRVVMVTSYYCNLSLASDIYCSWVACSMACYITQLDYLELNCLALHNHLWRLPPTTMDILQLKLEIQTMML